MDNSEIIKLIESSNSRLFKESIILEQMKKGNDIFFKGLSFAYNKLLTFGVKQLPVAEKNGQGLDWIEFSMICEKLIKTEKRKLFRIFNLVKGDFYPSIFCPSFFI